MDFNIARLAYLPKIIPKSQNNTTAQNQNNSTAQNLNIPGNKNPIRDNGVNLSSSLQNLLSSPTSLNGDWTDRFSAASQLLGASSFAELGAAKFESGANVAIQSTIHATLVYNSHANHNAVHATGRNLEYLDQIGKSFSSMINALKSLNGADEEAISAIASDFEDGAARAAFYANAAVGEFGDILDTLGLGTEKISAGQAVRDSSEFTNTILNKDYSLDEFEKMKEREKTERKGFTGDKEATRAEADDVLNRLFSAEVFSNGKLDQNALGVPDGNFTELANDPEKLQTVVAKLEAAFGALEKTIVSQGEHYKELKRADEYYERSLNEYDEGRYGPRTLEDLQLAVKQYSPEEKVSFIGDFWAEQIEKNRDRNILEWLKNVENGLGGGKEYEPLEPDKGNERLLDNIRALAQRTEQKESDAGEDAKLHEQREAGIADAEQRETFIDDALDLIFSSGIDYKTGSFGRSDDTLIENFNDLISHRPATGQTETGQTEQ